MVNMEGDIHTGPAAQVADCDDGWGGVRVEELFLRPPPRDGKLEGIWWRKQASPGLLKELLWRQIGGYGEVEDTYHLLKE